MEQLSLDLFPHHAPRWEDVYAGTAQVVKFEPYSKPCHSRCLWNESIFERCGVSTCYLFNKPILGGMCPCSIDLVWKV